MVVVVVVVVQGDRKDLKTATGGYWPLLSAIERLGSWGDAYSDEYSHRATGSPGYAELVG